MYTERKLLFVTWDLCCYNSLPLVSVAKGLALILKYRALGSTVLHPQIKKQKEASHRNKDEP